MLVQQSPSFNSAYLPQLFPLFGLDPGGIDYDVRPPIFTPELALWQIQLDRGDSGMYGRRLRSGRAHLLMLMSQHDETVNNINTESLAGAIGVPTVGEIEARYVDLPVASAPLRGNVPRDGGALTRGLYIHAPATHGG